jgi:magnesium chelatase family protein
VKYKELRGDVEIESSREIRKRVIRARARQTERFAAEKGGYSKAQMPPRLIRKYCAINPEREKLLETTTPRLGLSARAHDRMLKVSRTIADLDGSASIAP